MYIAITPQKLGTGYSSSVSDYVAYLEKENESLDKENQEFFFTQNEDRAAPNIVVSEIDRLTPIKNSVSVNFLKMVQF